MNKKFDSIINIAGISVADTVNCLLIRTKFRFFNRSNWDITLLLISGPLFIVIPILFVEDMIFIILSSVLGGIMFIMAMIGVLEQLTNFVKIGSDNIIKFRNGFETNTFRLDPKMKMIVRRDTELVSAINKPSIITFIHFVELYLVHDGNEYRVFHFNVGSKYSEKANRLGSELAHLIEKRIKAIDTI